MSRPRRSPDDIALRAVSALGAHCLRERHVLSLCVACAAAMQAEVLKECDRAFDRILQDICVLREKMAEWGRKQADSIKEVVGEQIDQVRTLRQDLTRLQVELAICESAKAMLQVEVERLRRGGV